MKFLFLVILSLSIKVLAKERVTSTNLSCSFESANLSISIQNFKAQYQTGTSPLHEATFIEAGKSFVRKTKSAVATGRSSWVANDLQDKRPAILVDFENNRLVIYYCSGDGKIVQAKYFTGHFEKQGASEFISSKVDLGTCTGDNLTDILTNDCSSFK